jgi:endonuclease YncB( thermonuclease family)
VLYDNKDIVTELLSRGLAKIRGEKINCDHIDDYKDAEEDAQMAERGIWSEENKPEGAYRYLKKTWTDK